MAVKPVLRTSDCTTGLQKPRLGPLVWSQAQPSRFSSMRGWSILIFFTVCYLLCYSYLVTTRGDFYTFATNMQRCMWCGSLAYLVLLAAASLACAAAGRPCDTNIYLINKMHTLNSRLHTGYTHATILTLISLI